MKVLQDIKDDGATKIGIVTDHGHRGGQDHFVILLCWSGRKKNGARTLKFFCPSIDRCGHTAQQAAEGVKKVTQRFLGSNTEIEVSSICGDSGGGGAVQNLHPKLIELTIMAEDSKQANCSLHGMNKSIENSSKNTMGDQGMGCRSPFQLEYVFAALMDWIREEGGIQLINTLWALIQNEMVNNSK